MWLFKKKVRISEKWLAMAEIYKRFAVEYPQADFSDAAAMAMYEHETHGKPLERTEKLNGFAIGKKWMDVTIAAWKEDIANRGLLVSELITDGYPEWFLERVGVLHSRAEWSECEWWMKVPNPGLRIGSAPIVDRGVREAHESKVRSRYPNASAERERSGEWCVWDISHDERKRLNEKHWQEAFGRGLFGIGSTEDEAWADAARKIEQREGSRFPVPNPGDNRSLAEGG